MGRMKLMTKEIEKKFKSIGSQEDKGRDAQIILKIFNPYGNATWYFTEFEPESRLLFGFASLFQDHNDEWGYTSLDELVSLQPIPGLYLERDAHLDHPKVSEMTLICKKMGWQLPDHPRY
ncbi:MAG: DUF2958 domain-containing protein [Pseudodesulfovibrio sp.]|nr:DUF2958 domain-containing protein [Pseudodesulfovibrio sp.]